MTGFKTSGDEFFPNIWELFLACPKEVNSLATGNLGVEVPFLGNGADGDEFVGSDFSSGNSRDDGVGAVFLHVGEKAVIGVLKSNVVIFKDVFIPAGGKDAGDGRFADFAAVTFAVFIQEFIKGVDLFHPDQAVEFLSGVGEVFTDVGIDVDAAFGKFAIEDLLAHGGASAASGSGFGFGLDFANGGGAIFDTGDEVAFADIVAGADVGSLRKCIDSDTCGSSV